MGIGFCLRNECFRDHLVPRNNLVPEVPRRSRGPRVTEGCRGDDRDSPAGIEHQQVIISVVNVDLANPDMPAEAGSSQIPDWWKVYEGLSDEEEGHEHDDERRTQQPAFARIPTQLRTARRGLWPR